MDALTILQKMTWSRAFIKNWNFIIIQRLLLTVTFNFLIAMTFPIKGVLPSTRMNCIEYCYPPIPLIKFLISILQSTNRHLDFMFSGNFNYICKIHRNDATSIKRFLEFATIIVLSCLVVSSGNIPHWCKSCLKRIIWKKYMKIIWKLCATY